MIIKSAPYLPLLNALSLFSATAGFIWLPSCSSDNGSAESTTTATQETETQAAPASAVSDKGAGPIT